MYWKYIQLCLCIVRKSFLYERVLRLERNRLIDTLVFPSFSFLPLSVKYVIPSKHYTQHCSLKVLCFSLLLCFRHSPGSALVRAPPQLELYVVSSPAAWHLASDLQHPRTPRWRCSVLPRAQQCWHRPTRHQHLQPLRRFWLPHWGLFFSPSYISFSQFFVNCENHESAHSSCVFFHMDFSSLFS